MRLAECVKHDDAADAETNHGSQSSDLQEVGAQAEPVGEDGRDREDEPQYVEPQWRSYGSAKVFAQTELQ